ncbi:MAG: AraC-type DNA-binding protein [Devosia sp.]|nr:AraC-type DNA-binding protein [Devosia sp.]
MAGRLDAHLGHRGCHQSRLQSVQLAQYVVGHSCKFLVGHRALRWHGQSGIDFAIGDDLTGQAPEQHTGDIGGGALTEPGGNVLDVASAPGDSRVCYLIVDETLLPDLDLRQVEPIRAVAGYPGTNDLADWALSVLSSAPTTMRQSPGAMEQVLPGMIADRVWEVCSRMIVAESDKRPRETYSYSLFKRARSRVMDDPDQVLGVADLAAYLNVPEHVLRGAFLDAAGVTPRTWLRIYRLDRARRAILQSGGTPRTVAQVAMEAGFFHLGRFSAYYAQLFHETPLETLKGALA